MEYYRGQLKDYKYNIKKTYSKKKDENGKHIKILKCGDIFTFDIECSSGYLDPDGNVLEYVKGKSSEYWNTFEKVSLCYIWQFSCNEHVYYGRTLEEFKQLLEDLPQAKLIIFVHNLAYEFNAALLNVLHITDVFARTPQHPLKCNPAEYPNIEFRCTLSLTGMSLDAWGKEIGFNKQTGLLDYNKLRTPLTELTDDELKYCEYDCLVVYHGILDLLKEYNSVWRLPLTSTGRVRREFKRRLTCNKEYMQAVKRRVPSAVEYKLLQQVYAGGYTHASRLWSNEVVRAADHDDKVIEHYDFTSSYPYCLCAFNQYPCTNFVYDYRKKLPTDKELNKYAWIIDIELFDVQPLTFHSYLQTSKCVVEGAVYDNGRLCAADYVHIKINEFDWLIIRQLYAFGSINVKHLYRANKSYLHRDIIEYILELYANKTIYKNVPGKEQIYINSKKYVNSCYGMFVTAPISRDVIFDGEEWYLSDLPEEKVRQRLKELKSFKDSNTAYFLDYSTGVWCTSIARYNLFTCILKANNADDAGRNVLYSDTDSCFILGKSDYSWYNQECINRLHKMCDYYNFSYDVVSPTDSKGKAHTLGFFEKEEDIKEFVSCHAKCYCEKRFDDKLYMTISGIRKNAVVQLKDIYDFKDGKEFDKDNDSTNKNIVTYKHDMPIVTYPDGYTNTYRHGVHMMPTGYLISVTDEYDRLNQFSKDFTALPQHSIIRLRGMFA